jgi:hypothetical protein
MAALLVLSGLATTPDLSLEFGISQIVPTGNLAEKLDFSLGNDKRCDYNFAKSAKGE